MATRKRSTKSAKRGTHGGTRGDVAKPDARAAGKPRGGRERMNLMVDRAVLERASLLLGTTNLSDVVNVALRKMAEDDMIVAGIDALLGAFPDLPDERDDA